MNLSLFELYLKFMTVMYFILFYLNLWLNIYFLNNFVNTREYSWIPADMKKIGGYPYNGYPTDMGTGTGQIFIQQVGYKGTTTRTLPAPLTSLHPPCAMRPSWATTKNSIRSCLVMAADWKIATGFRHIGAMADIQ